MCIPTPMCKRTVRAHPDAVMVTGGDRPKRTGWHVGLAIHVVTPANQSTVGPNGNIVEEARSDRRVGARRSNRLPHDIKAPGLERAICSQSHPVSIAGGHRPERSSRDIELTVEVVTPPQQRAVLDDTETKADAADHRTEAARGWRCLPAGIAPPTDGWTGLTPGCSDTDQRRKCRRERTPSIFSTTQTDWRQWDQLDDSPSTPP